ncbi:MAG: hypothetical protein AAGH60_08330 [Pseudomonadota bacterium]
MSVGGPDKANVHEGDGARCDRAHSSFMGGADREGNVSSPAMGRSSTVFLPSHLQIAL